MATTMSSPFTLNAMMGVNFLNKARLLIPVDPEVKQHLKEHVEGDWKDATAWIFVHSVHFKYYKKVVAPNGVSYVPKVLDGGDEAVEGSLTASEVKTIHLAVVWFCFKAFQQLVINPQLAISIRAECGNIQSTEAFRDSLSSDKTPILDRTDWLNICKYYFCPRAQSLCEPYIKELFEFITTPKSHVIQVVKVRRT